MLITRPISQLNQIRTINIHHIIIHIITVKVTVKYLFFFGIARY